MSTTVDLRARILAVVAAEMWPDRLAAAVRATLDLHRGVPFAGIVACLACSPGMPPAVLVASPCKTVKGIARELGVDSTDGTSSVGANHPDGLLS